ncbi:MAG: hypothetical protein LRY73_05295 [Bacillus sp. (in: Bacteria)]|nr:hypothetical protein [Bacillus sp. (in: firmicutes)]
MLNLEHLKDCYGLKQANWKVTNELLETDKGLKRLINWTDEKKVRWHIHWRDQLAQKTNCLTNRMIQTIHGERMLLTDAGWVTLHDEVTSLYSYKKREKEMGMFFGKYFSMDMTEVEIEVHAPNTENLGEVLKSPISKDQLVEPEHKRFVESLRRESLKRFYIAMEMKDKEAGKREPVLAPIKRLDEGKIVYGKLFWATSHENPEKGYGSLRNVLTEWLQRYGQTSLFQLLDEMDSYFPIKDHHGKSLLAECLLPWEFLDFKEKSMSATAEDEFLVWKEQLTYRWEASRALVVAIDEWLDVTRKKVKL